MNKTCQSIRDLPGIRAIITLMVLSGFLTDFSGYVWASTPAFMQSAAIAGIFGVSLITVVAAAIPASLAGPGRDAGAHP
jgi:apolipoprotein N-acyltransferase